MSLSISIYLSVCAFIRFNYAHVHEEMTLIWFVNYDALTRSRIPAILLGFESVVWYVLVC